MARRAGQVRAVHEVRSIGEHDHDGHGLTRLRRHVHGLLAADRRGPTRQHNRRRRWWERPLTDKLGVDERVVAAVVARLPHQPNDRMAAQADDLVAHGHAGRHGERCKLLAVTVDGQAPRRARARVVVGSKIECEGVVGAEGPMLVDISDPDVPR